MSAIAPTFSARSDDVAQPATGLKSNETKYLGRLLAIWLRLPVNVLGVLAGLGGW
jgi:hypothetical protein